jgi:hypothetical protein
MSSQPQEVASNARLDHESGQRAWFLEEARTVEADLGFSTSNFTVVPAAFFVEMGIDADPKEYESALTLANGQGGDMRNPHPELISRYARIVAPHLGSLLKHIQPLDGMPIISRPSPIDESHRPDLSFAGAYKGYMPLHTKRREDHLVTGTASMLAGRFTQYGNIYYERHQIPGNRQVGAIYMEPFMQLGKDIPLFYGTAYIAGSHIRNEYNVAPIPGQPQRSARLTVERDGQRWHEQSDQTQENAHNFTERIDYALTGLQEHFGMPLDIEYLVDPKDNLYIVQIRPISARHLANWDNLPMVDEAAIGHRSAVINSIGTIAGKVVDLRSDVHRVAIDDLPGNITVINHEARPGGVDSQMLFRIAAQHNLKDLRVLIDHGDARLRDHLQYALGEDPGITFLAQTTDPAVRRNLRNNDHISVSSNGITLEVAA